MSRFRVIGLVLALAMLLSVALPGNAHAASAPIREKGLLITPIRQYLSASAGKSTQSSLSVANLTDNTLVVSLSVQQFSVTDYAYNYVFEAPTNDWVHLSRSNVSLAPNQTVVVPYTIAIPRSSAPGGHYYTLFASANVTSGGVDNTIQAADLLYLTVSGVLSTVSHLQGSSIQWLNFGRTIPYNLQPVNTGNVYSFVYVGGELHGLFVRPPQTSAAHLLIPDKVRSLSDSIPSPLLPGVYRALYGYKTTSGWAIQQSRWIVYIPPWSIALLLALLLLGGKLLPGSKLRKKSGKSPGAAKN